MGDGGSDTFVLSRFHRVGDGSRFGGVSAKPSFHFTDLDSICNLPLCSPSRVAVMVIIPPVSVDRIATRLMPHSVLR